MKEWKKRKNEPGLAAMVVGEADDGNGRSLIVVQNQRERVSVTCVTHPSQLWGASPEKERHHRTFSL